MMVNQLLNHNCINRAGVRDKDPVQGRINVNPEHCWTVLNNQEITSVICLDLVF